MNDNKKYTHIKSEYKMIIYEHAKISEKEDNGSIKENYLNYIKINEINEFIPMLLFKIFKKLFKLFFDILFHIYIVISNFYFTCSQ